MKNTRNTFILLLLLSSLLSSCRIGDCGCPMTYEKGKEVIESKDYRPVDPAVLENSTGKAPGR